MAAEAATACAEAAVARAASGVAAATRALASARFQVAGYKSGDGLTPRRATNTTRRSSPTRAISIARVGADRGTRAATSFYNAALLVRAGFGQIGLGVEVPSGRGVDAGFDNAEPLASDTDPELDPRRPPLPAHPAGDHPHRHGSRRSCAPTSRSTGHSRRPAPSDPGAWKSLGMTLMRSGDPSRGRCLRPPALQIDASPNALYNQVCASRAQRRAREGAGRAGRSRFWPASATTSRCRGLRPGHAARRPALRPWSSSRATSSSTATGSTTTTAPPGAPAIWRFQRVTREHPQVGRAWFNLGFASCAAPTCRAADSRSPARWISATARPPPCTTWRVSRRRRRTRCGHGRRCRRPRTPEWRCTRSSTTRISIPCARSALPVADGAAQGADDLEKRKAEKS